jgi:hypothetical protein
MKMLLGQKNVFCTQHISNLQRKQCLRNYQRRPLRRFTCMAAELLEIPSKFSKVSTLHSKLSDKNITLKQLFGSKGTGLVTPARSAISPLGLPDQSAHLATRLA